MILAKRSCNRSAVLQHSYSNEPCLRVNSNQVSMLEVKNKIAALGSWLPVASWTFLADCRLTRSIQA